MFEIFVSCLLSVSVITHSVTIPRVSGFFTLHYTLLMYVYNDGIAPSSSSLFSQTSKPVSLTNAAARLWFTTSLYNLSYVELRPAQVLCLSACVGRTTGGHSVVNVSLYCSMAEMRRADDRRRRATSNFLEYRSSPRTIKNMLELDYPRDSTQLYGNQHSIKCSPEYSRHMVRR